MRRLFNLLLVIHCVTLSPNSTAICCPPKITIIDLCHPSPNQFTIICIPNSVPNAFVYLLHFLLLPLVPVGTYCTFSSIYFCLFVQQIIVFCFCWFVAPVAPIDDVGVVVPVVGSFSCVPVLFVLGVAVLNAVALFCVVLVIVAVVPFIFMDYLLLFLGKLLCLFQSNFSHWRHVVFLSPFLFQSPACLLQVSLFTWIISSFFVFSSVTNALKFAPAPSSVLVLLPYMMLDLLLLLSSYLVLSFSTRSSCMGGKLL